MTRHLADQPRIRGNARLREFLRQVRAETPHPATLSLQARPKQRTEQPRKTAEFLRIARGLQA
ncbi:hypothetical protein [Paracoccus beibuensis]|uniref:hypothetical protein n=1 Tax=Paracoccus beibuensis TaxID=547602 RepID=UPI0022406B56|nr:hypothetical protein [Paracoccus beibuensis]